MRFIASCPRNITAHNPCHTDSVQEQNVTFIVDSEVLKAARRLAIDHDTSVSQIVRDDLGRLVQYQDAEKAASAGLREFFRKHNVTFGKRTWTRDELHERR
jgi:hypothetical protein